MSALLTVGVPSLTSGAAKCQELPLVRFAGFVSVRLMLWDAVKGFELGNSIRRVRRCSNDILSDLPHLDRAFVIAHCVVLLFDEPLLHRQAAIAKFW